MANHKKRFEFENTFGNNSRSPKRPKLEVIQRPSISGIEDEVFENVDENDDLWGDELETDVVQEALLLESQVLPSNPPSPKCEPTQKSTVSVFKPKTATTFPKHVTGAEKSSGCRSVLRDSGVKMKETKDPERRLLKLTTNDTGVIEPLVVEKIKTHSIGKGCIRSNSMPAFDARVSSSTHSKPWSEIKDLSIKLVDDKVVNTSIQSDSSRPVDNSEEMKALQKEIERLRSEAFTKAGEAALLRQKIKDASLDLERERSYRATLLEKTNQKHQQEVLVLNRELEASKTQLQFKELDVDKAIEKCKLLEAGNLKVRPMELKLHSTLRSSNTSDFPNRSTFESSTPKKRHHSDVELKQNVPKTCENTTNRIEFSETGVQTEDKFVAMQKSHPQLFSRVSEGKMLSQLIVPVWFEMDSGATEEQFENKWEGVSAITELLKMPIFQGEPLKKLVEWCWKRTLGFLSSLHKRSEDDYKFHQIREESKRQYEEWCLDRRIPLPPQKQPLDEGLGDDLFSEFSEDCIKDELQCLLSYRPWCTKDVLPEIRRTLALIIALIRVSKNMASAFSSHNQRSDDEDHHCYVCGSVIQKELKSVQMSKEQDKCNSIKNREDIPSQSSEPLGVSVDNSCTESLEMGGMPTCPVSKKSCDSEIQQEIEGPIESFLKYDFVHVAQQICRVISGMRKILPMEGTLAGVLAFLTSLGEQLVLSRRALLMVSAVIKDILFICPQLRILPLLMRLLYVTGEYPLILQKLCVNSAWNTAYRDKWNSIWMFSRGVCPLQVLITVLENVVDERFPDAVSKEVWCRYRARIALLFVQWLDAALTQPGHQVNWLCYITSDELGKSQKKSVGSAPDHKKSTNPEEKTVKSKKGTSTQSQRRVKSDEPKPSTSRENSKKTSDVAELRKKNDDENPDENDGDNLPYKSLTELSISNSEESDNGKKEVEEPSKKCCCRRWTINSLVNILYAILSDLQSVINPDSEYTVKEEGKELYYNAKKTIISNKKLEHEQSLCLRLGLFVLRALLRRDYPELNTPGGEGFLWNHYTVKGSVLINGQIVRKDYSHKNTHGGPIGGRYVLLLSKIEKQLKGKILDFCPETEKALQELLEVEHSVQSPSEDDEEEEDRSDIWDCLRNIGCNKDP